MNTVTPQFRNTLPSKSPAFIILLNYECSYVHHSVYKSLYLHSPVCYGRLTADMFTNTRDLLTEVRSKCASYQKQTPSGILSDHFHHAIFCSDRPRRPTVFQLKQWRVTTSGQISPAVVKVSQMKQKQQFDAQSNLWNRLQPWSSAAFSFLLQDAYCHLGISLDYEIIVSAPCL